MKNKKVLVCLLTAAMTTDLWWGKSNRNLKRRKMKDMIK